eukprot:NODE_10169_length_1372_cov_2.207229.p1 GENE.NODE_10169_length_1372_cov_2.207229~~NODE_10169_length_1372_cov_2.207229.p1  ORF type:complete len:223 (+),score=32.22 NODE_10169_length_1372_cov_2.207229:230-898(+)
MVEMCLAMRCIERMMSARVSCSISCCQKQRSDLSGWETGSSIGSSCVIKRLTRSASAAAAASSIARSTRGPPARDVPTRGGKQQLRHQSRDQREGRLREMFLREAAGCSEARAWWRRPQRHGHGGVGLQEASAGLRRGGRWRRPRRGWLRDRHDTGMQIFGGSASPFRPLTPAGNSRSKRENMQASEAPQRLSRSSALRGSGCTERASRTESSSLLDLGNFA